MEDEPFIAMDVELVLQRAGFEVATFGRCADAEAWLDHGRPAVAVLDVTLPDGQCVAVARTLVERQIPFIIHSGEDERILAVDAAFQSGQWLMKPSMTDELGAAAMALVKTADATRGHSAAAG